MTLLIDLGDVPACYCDSALEHLFKAMSESPSGDDRSMWAPVDNPFLTAHVEDVTHRLQAILQQIQDILAQILTGSPIGSLQKSDAPWLRMDEEQMAMLRARLESKLPEFYTLDDWLDLVDFLIARYLPPDVINDEAEYLTVRAALLGKIQASSGQNRPVIDPLAGWLALVPTHFAAVPPRALSQIEQEMLYVAKTRAATAIGSVTDSARARMRTIVTEHVQAAILGQKEGVNTALKTRLFDEFGQLNRDFRRIAVTEAGECANQGFVAAQSFGARIKRKEAYRGACDFCRSIDGKVFTVVDPAGTGKNGQTEVWLGKTNIGRSASPRRREDGVLKDRDANTRWWPAAGVQHPHCRGSWTLIPTAKPGVSPDFVKFMDELMARAKP